MKGTHQHHHLSDDGVENGLPSSNHSLVAIVLFSHFEHRLFLGLLPMKFLLDIISCCVPVNMSRSLAPISTRKLRRRKRGALTSSAAKLAADWKPSLGAISEDKVVLVVMEREKSDDRTAESERSVKRRSGSRDEETTVHRQNRRSPSAIPVVIPAFSPTPFLF